MQPQIDLDPPLGPPGPALALQGRWKLAAEGAAVFYLGAIAALGFLTSASYAFFPELAALAYDVLTRPGEVGEGSVVPRHDTGARGGDGRGNHSPPSLLVVVFFLDRPFLSLRPA